MQAKIVTVLVVVTKRNHNTWGRDAPTHLEARDRLTEVIIKPLEVTAS